LQSVRGKKSTEQGGGRIKSGGFLWGTAKSVSKQPTNKHGGEKNEAREKFPRRSRKIAKLSDRRNKRNASPPFGLGANSLK